MLIDLMLTSIQADPATSSASHVELSFKDEYLARSDMWRLAVAELSNKTVFKGQKILFMGTIKSQISCVYVDGRKVQSAFFSTNTKPIFRSESARYVLFIQMSKEMWDFDSEGSGEIMFNKVVNGFLPALFKKWVSLKAKHLVSIVLFTRVEYDTGLTSEIAASAHDSEYHTGIQRDGNKKPYKDFYRVVVSEMASGSWTTILYQLKREFKFFRKDISLHRIDSVNDQASEQSESSGGALGTRIEAEPSLAMHGNVLEAINLAASQFSHDYIDRDLMRTGISVILITPCPGLFEVDYETLRMTTESLTANGIGIDLVCLPKMPLHSVPLFRFRNPEHASFQEALNFKSLRSEDSTPRQSAGFGSSFSTLNESLSPTKAYLTDRMRAGSVAGVAQLPSEWSYAIPHWIDVSFWTGASQDHVLKNSISKSTSKHLQKFGSKRSSDFAVRCKMYEMEMASVMENVMTEIAVTPLQNDALFPQLVNGPRDVLGNQPDQTAKIESFQRDQAYAGLVEFVAGPSKSVVDRHSTLERKGFYRALDIFDQVKSELQKDHIGVEQKGDKKSFKAGSDEMTKQLLADDPKIFGTSFTDDAVAPKGLNFMQTTLHSRGESDLRELEGMAKPRKQSLSSVVPNSKTSQPKNPKLGRQISLGKHGFGIAAPKVAVAELQIEHVSAARPSSSNTKAPEVKKTKSTMAENFLGNASSQRQERPSSSQSEGPMARPETSQSDSKSYLGSGTLEKSEISSARPIAIRNSINSIDSLTPSNSRSVLGSLYDGFDQHKGDDSNILKSMRPDDTQKLFNSKLLAGSVPELPSTLTPTIALSPWLNVLNPSNPSVNDLIGPSQYRRWQHVFPRPILTQTMKWKSLCSPASVPLTTEYFPTKYQLDTEYHQKPYNISQNIDDDLNENPKTREEFLRDLIGLRLSQGFQIVVGPAVAQAFGQKSIKISNVFDRDRIAEDGASVFMSMGNTIHQLSCVNETEVEVNMFVRKPTASATGDVRPSVYKPAIRVTLDDNYESRQIVLGKPRDDYNWNYVDSLIAGFDDEMSESSRFWRARFVLIPVERPGSSQRRHDEDNEEEIRLEGIKKLTQMWQRNRVLTASERRFQTPAYRKTKDLNPLDIVYRTEDPSVVVTAELETLPLVEGEWAPRRGHLLESERFRKAKLDIAELAEAIQAPAEKGGVRMQNRRWHFRLHYNCFIGSDMTTWLIENFEDIETREEAVELGNMLMVMDEMQKVKEGEVLKSNGKDRDKNMGVFVHVEKRHPFRDGQYFYQITGEFSKQRSESKSGWFASRRRDNSIPSTPMSENRDSPRPVRSQSSHEDISSDSGTCTPTTTGGGKKPKVALSKVMKYDVDRQKRSYRPERINLHYDRLHNPDNCYHIRIDWMGVTAKLIEDAIETWAVNAERYGLRLVEVPIGEACTISAVHPFRKPYEIKPAVKPPDQQPKTYFDLNSFVPQAQNSPANRHYYQKAMMKRFNFVLDIEAARNFPNNVDVTFSWGKPDFKYTQYIHRSGMLLAEITDDGNFLLLANRLYNNRTTSIRESERYLKLDYAEKGIRIPTTPGHGLNQDRSPYNSPILRPTQIGSPVLHASSDVLGLGLAGSKLAGNVTPEAIMREFQDFCHNSIALEAFYKDVYEKSTSPPAATPVIRSSYAVNVLESHIPALGLPSGVLARDTSPSPMRLSNTAGPANSVSVRRPSVQLGGLPLSMEGLKDGPRGWTYSPSPRGSMHEDDNKAL